MLYGIALLPEGRRRQSLESVVDLIFPEGLADRVLPSDSAAAGEFADIAASRRRAGRPISEADPRIETRQQIWGKALTLPEAVADTATFVQRFTVLEDGLADVGSAHGAEPPPFVWSLEGVRFTTPM